MHTSGTWNVAERGLLQSLKLTSDRPPDPAKCFFINREHIYYHDMLAYICTFPIPLKLNIGNLILKVNEIYLFIKKGNFLIYGWLYKSGVVSLLSIVPVVLPMIKTETQSFQNEILI